jgi:hypothetical protein
MKRTIGMRLVAGWAILSAPLMVMADQVVYPPLNGETLIGIWEALWPQQPPTLWQMTVNRAGDSYLVEATLGYRVDSSAYIVRRLISSEVKEGSVWLHFGKGSSKDMPNELFPEIWVIGTGSGTEARGAIDATLSGERLNSIPPPAPVFGSSEKGHIYFIKGTWTRDLGEASKKAEQSIRKMSTP